MNDYILLMHDDAPTPVDESLWPSYFARLRANGIFGGGSAFGKGETVRQEAPFAPITAHITGYVRVHAESLEGAKALVFGNPVYEAGGTVEVRLLPKD